MHLDVWHYARATPSSYDLVPIILYAMGPGRKPYALATTFNLSGWTNHNVDTPLSGACHRCRWGPTGTPWGRAEGSTM